MHASFVRKLEKLTNDEIIFKHYVKANISQKISKLPSIKILLFFYFLIVFVYSFVSFYSFFIFKSKVNLFDFILLLSALYSLYYYINILKLEKKFYNPTTFYLIKFSSKEKACFLLGPFLENTLPQDYEKSTKAFIPLEKVLLEEAYSEAKLPWSDMYDKNEKPFKTITLNFYINNPPTEQLSGKFNLLESHITGQGIIPFDKNTEKILELAKKFLKT